MLTDGRMDGRKSGRLYRNRLQAGATKMEFKGVKIIWAWFRDALGGPCSVIVTFFLESPYLYNMVISV